MYGNRLAIFASGGGSNARCILDHLTTQEELDASLVISNRSSAGVHGVAAEFSVPSVVVRKSEMADQEAFLKLLQSYEVGYIALAGFLLMIPPYLVEAYRGRIFNIHPSLLPKYGGKGMYGLNVHKAVKAAAELESGMTIHHVTEAYDEGAIILQARVPLKGSESPEDIAKKVLEQEHRYYPLVVAEMMRYGLKS